MNALKFAFDMENAIGQLMKAPLMPFLPSLKVVKVTVGVNSIHFLAICCLPVCKTVDFLSMYIPEGLVKVSVCWTIE